MRQADLIISCVDHDGARLVAAFVATAYHRLHLDVATGVHVTPGDAAGLTNGAGRRNMGADVRLVVPGAGCLLCYGGLRDFGAAMRNVLAPEAVGASPIDWSTQRAGSSR